MRGSIGVVGVRESESPCKIQISLNYKLIFLYIIKLPKVYMPRTPWQTRITVGTPPPREKNFWIRARSSSILFVYFFSLIFQKLARIPFFIQVKKK